MAGSEGMLDHTPTALSFSTKAFPTRGYVRFINSHPLAWGHHNNKAFSQQHPAPRMLPREEQRVPSGDDGFLLLVNVEKLQKRTRLSGNGRPRGENEELQCQRP